MALMLQKVILGSSISFSFILSGNAITQSFMTVPALLEEFPPPNSPDYSARATLLGRQWPYCWAVGNVFFRPISTIGMLGYVYTAYAASPYSSNIKIGDTRLFALCALCNLIGIIHSAVNMQPINDKLAALDVGSKEAKIMGIGSKENQLKNGEELLRTWGKWNIVRIVCPLIAGTIAMWQIS